MNFFLKFLTMIDIFGITFTFRYKDKERYQTAIGGFIVLLFFIFRCPSYLLLYSFRK